MSEPADSGGQRESSKSNADLRQAFDALAGRRVILVGGKGGVGKTTLASALALHLSQSRQVTLFTTDPASNLSDLFPDGGLPRLKLEALDASALYRKFLDQNIDAFLEIGDRGTYLDRDELRRFFELSLPGVDELMAWLRIGELAVADATVVVDTAPTGHTLRMLSSSAHFEQLSKALDAMQAKHRAMVRQFTRRNVTDAIDRFIDDFSARHEAVRKLLTDPDSSAFVPVMLAEPWVVEQTRCLIAELRAESFAVPFAILNRAVSEPDCPRDRLRTARDQAAFKELPSLEVVSAARSCTPLDGADAIARWLQGDAPANSAASPERSPHSVSIAITSRLTFVAGKGGVGKTTTALSIALQLAQRQPECRFALISVDPAQTLTDAFAREQPPANLAVITIDTRSRWREFRDRLGGEIERAAAALSPAGMTVEYDVDAMRQLIEIAPPGADELFAVIRLADLLGDDSLAKVIVDTAPTGHFLRLLELPRTAGEWVREFMRLLLRYRDLIPAGTLGEELVRASRALKDLDEALHSSERASVVIVTRPERVVVAETGRLADELAHREVTIAGVIANAMTPDDDCRCDRTMRAYEESALAALGRPVVLVERREHPITELKELEALVPIAGS